MALVLLADALSNALRRALDVTRGSPGQCLGVRSMVVLVALLAVVAQLAVAGYGLVGLVHGRCSFSHG